MKNHEIGDSHKKLFKGMYRLVRCEGIRCSTVCYFAMYFAEKFGERTVLEIIRAAEKAQQHNNKPLDAPISVRLGLYKGLKQQSENMNNW